MSRTPPDEVRRRERELAAAQSAEVQTLLLTPFTQSPRLDFGQVGLIFVIGASQQLGIGNMCVLRLGFLFYLFLRLEPTQFFV